MNDVGPGHLTVALSETTAPYGGTVDLNPSGAFDFTPTPGFCGVATFVYELRTDSTVITAVPAVDTATASIRVDCVPVAGNDGTTVPEDSGASTITVLSNDADPDPGQTLTITGVTQAVNGSVAIVELLNGTMAVSYTPNADFAGADSFNYVISDGHGGNATGTVAMTVTPVNDAPSFDVSSNQMVAEDAGPQTVNGLATAMSAGPANEAGQALSFTRCQHQHRAVLGAARR